MTNNNFLLNILADFTGNKDLGATRSRSITTPEFTVVADIELEILKKYESKLKDLELKRKSLEKEITDKYRDDDWLLKKDTDEKIKELATQNGLEFENLKASLRKNGKINEIREELKAELTMDFILKI